MLIFPPKSDRLLGPQAVRDTSGTPDLGYHYPPLDYVVGGVVLATNLTFTAGTAVGWYEGAGNSAPSGQPYAMLLNNGANLTFSGTATQPCYVALYNLVQEGNGNWTGYGYMAGFILNGSGSSSLPQLSANFTKWSASVHEPPLRDNYDSGNGSMVNCEMYAAQLGAYYSSFYFTNCLMWRSLTSFNSADNTTIQNCTFFNGCLVLDRSSAAYWAILNNAFDGTCISTSDSYSGATNYTSMNYNAYDALNTNWIKYPYVTGIGTLETIGSHDQTNVAGFGWQSSWFGNFYLPPTSPLINAGNTTADKLGLYHFTTETNQVVEGTSIVDLGYHYVATDAYGNPLDTNGDGIPDYLEDANGDGVYDAGDLGNWLISPYNGLNTANVLSVFTPLK